MKILFLSRWFPYPADNGSKLRIYNLLRLLSRSHTVDLISFTAAPLQDNQTAGLEGLCRRVEAVVYRPFQPGRLRALLGYLSPLPRAYFDTYSPALDRLARQAASREQYDLIFASEIDMAPYAAGLPARARILEDLELSVLYEHYALQTNPIKRMRARLTWTKLTSYLRRLLRDFQGCTTVTETERQRLLAVVPEVKSSAVVPNGVDLSYLSGDFGLVEPGTLLYNGAMTYHANYDAVHFFLGDIFPRVLASRPSTRLFVTGSTEGVPLDRLPARDQVIFTGYIRDVRARVSQTWASVVPLRIGAGTRLKILESLALGTPVISTSKGAEGLALRPGLDFLCADTPVAFANAVLRLLDNADLRQELALAGRKAVERYDWETIGQDFLGYVDRVVGSR